ncbi:hypothetical protein C1708_33395 [Streptomyces sp. DH-12]|uniref:hypothetical protein n=1 Tax=Streptomyces sp. DH-12 TaxID=2072509 RepID=UPI000CCFC614|nr:hypothetical protein [Streptomyces sp. DH-12]PNV30846.1 hypothetical protein C1708_33395 [Streptomyces sp. DH-12]
MLLHAFDASQLTESQCGLLGRVLHALDPQALAGEHASASNSALLALTRARAGLAGSAADGQPQPELLQRVIRSALACARQAEGAFQHGGGHTLFQQAETFLTAADTDLTAHLRTRRRPLAPLPSAGHLAAGLDALFPSLVTAVQDWVVRLWSQPPADYTLQDTMQGELAVLLALQGRDEERLAIDLQSLLMQGPVHVQQIMDVLWPAPQKRVLTLLVQGARKLMNLEDLLPGSRQWGLVDHQPVGDSSAPQTVTDFARWVGPLGSHALIVQFPVTAADILSSVVLGRRELSQALDQYAAGERLVELRIAEPWMIRTANGKSQRGTSTTPTAKHVYPLTKHQPHELLPAMRAVSLARRVDAPMTSAALSWSALESTGLTPKQAGPLAKACALQTLRQQIISLHPLLVMGARARLNQHQIRVQAARGQLKRHERAVHDSSQSDSAAALAAAAQHRQLASQAAAILAQEETAHLEAKQNVRAWEDALRQHVPTPPQQEDYLLDIGCWLQMLTPPRANDPAQLRAARDAVDSLSAFTGGHSATRLRLWRVRLADPSALAQYMQHQQEVYEATLHWLYVTRNLAFHRGQFSGPADVMSAHAGRALVDMTLEFLGNWRVLEHAAGNAPLPATEVYKTLATRYDQLISRLTTPGATSHQLRVDHITGPDETWWI